MLTGRWRRVRSVHLIKVISSSGPDAGCRRPVDSSKVLERENHDQTHSVSAVQRPVTT